MLCDKLTPCITIYSEYTEMSKDINTSGKKKGGGGRRGKKEEGN